MPYPSPKLNGKPTAAALANGLATLGRYGDSYMVHASEGETIVPAEILDANPGLKDELLGQMQMMGIRDPNRYVVGNSLNSINPITGQPEFFFSSVFKAVKKVFKKVLPFVAPIVGNLIAPGIGGIVASGLATKLQGGSWGDALKSAAMSYGLGALGQGLTSSKGFMAGLGEGLTAPWEAATNIFSAGPANPLQQGIFGAGKMLDLGLGFSGPPVPTQPLMGSPRLGGLFPSYQGAAQLSGLGQPAGLGQPGGLQLPRPAGIGPFVRGAVTGTGSGAAPLSVRATMADLGPPRWAGTRTDPISTIRPGSFSERAYAVDLAQPRQLADPGQISETRTNLSPVDPQFVGEIGPLTTGSPTGDAVGGVDPRFTKIKGPYGEDIWLLDGEPWTGEPPPARLWPGRGGETAARLLETAAIPVALAGLTYLLSDDQDELTPDQQRALTDPQRYAYDQFLRLDPATRKNTPEGQQLMLQAGIVPSTDAATLAGITGTSLDQAERYLADAYGTPFTSTVVTTPMTELMRSKGGIMTLQGGGEITGPGSGISDSIPARLSDGEFVMTADAVRGAGSGSRDMGAARMYDLMSRFERAA